MVEHQPSKLDTWVRFPSPASFICKGLSGERLLFIFLRAISRINSSKHIQENLNAFISLSTKAQRFSGTDKDKNNLLELYNAMTGKQYTDSDLLEINTLENAIYMTMKNDISFLIDGRLSLYEHQSTYNPNLPLRFLFYISRLYMGMTKDENLYGTKTIQLPPPEFVIFYNGEEGKTGADGPEAFRYVQGERPAG